MPDVLAALPAAPAVLAARLLAWYDAGHRALPWRPEAGALGDPYRVWLSEVMLQQTTVAAVIPYFEKFLASWPTLAELAAAEDAAVMAAWAGLGYYSRARNLLACARAVAAEHGGRFPDTEEGLRALPGVGPYTAAAVAAIAFGRRAAAVDGNVERILARLTDDATPLPAFKPAARALGLALVPAERPGDFAQAAIDLGALVCRPREPDCLLCPWRDVCRARAAGTISQRPLRPPKAEKPHRRGTAFWVERDGCVWLVRRPAKGLLGGMAAFPCTEWSADPPPAALPPGWAATPLNATVRHVFTHFSLDLAVVKLSPPPQADPATAFGPGAWVPMEKIDGLPTVMEKVRAAAMGKNKTLRGDSVPSRTP
ncbi:A/G-specific adenine glycosylase [Oleispirillum naphthae]|uniref:A/G-specific adenine glycosylase n=1 Tax=Oleispirillum naphthae TaxID=2838853 RepID=UPI00308241BC